jgi:hypothetical protein
MTRALFLRLSTIAAVTLALCLIPESSFAQHGGGHGGGGGGAGFHGGGFGGSFHGGGGGFPSRGFGGFRPGFAGFPGGFGRGWGWGGWGWGGWGWGGWGWGWGWGLGWGWPWWFGYPNYGYWGPSAYGCSYYGSCDPYYSPSYGPGYVDPPSNGPGNYPQGNNSEPDWRHEPGPDGQSDKVQPDQSQPKPSHSPGSASPDSKLIIVNYVARPTPNERNLRSAGSHAYLAGLNSEQALPMLRPGVRNAIMLLRAMPPAARERWLGSGRYNKFSPQEQQLLRQYAGVSTELGARSSQRYF